jgi:sulfide:quinone oxidoreductase
MAPQEHIVVLGGNFAGLACAQQIHDACGDAVAITVIDRKDYLLLAPNIPSDVLANRDLAEGQTMKLRPVLRRDAIRFIKGAVTAIDPEVQSVTFVSAERPGAEADAIIYDYLVIALGCELSFDRIEGFADHGHSVTDLYHGERLRRHLHKGGYKGGKIAIGSAVFHQGDGAIGLEPYLGGSIPIERAACEGPPLEVTMSLAAWLEEHGFGGPDLLTVFTPAPVIAEDAGVHNVEKLLALAASMGVNYRNNMGDIRRLTAEGIEFENGGFIDAELKIVFPDWRAHAFLRDLPISDSEGFIVTDLTMRNPDYRNIFAAGDCASVTVPKLGAIGHHEAAIVARQIADDLGCGLPGEGSEQLEPVVFCIGDMGDGKAFYIRSNVWCGGKDEALELGRVPRELKMRHRDIFVARHGRVPDAELQLA